MNVFIGRENAIKLPLTVNDPPETVPVNTVLRAIFNFGGYCVDTDVATDPIELIDNETVVRMKLGLITNLREGTYEGFLTIFDSEAPNGLGWGKKARVKVHPWPVCD